MPTTLTVSLRDLKFSELEALYASILAKQDAIKVTGEKRVQTAHFWTLQTDAVRVYAEIGWRESRPDVVER